MNEVMQFNTVEIKIVWCKISIFSSISIQECGREIITPKIKKKIFLFPLHSILLWEWVSSIVTCEWYMSVCESEREKSYQFLTC